MQLNDIDIDLFEQAKLLGSNLSSLGDPLIIINNPKKENEKLQILYANEAFSKESGYLQHEAIGMSPQILQGENTDKGTLKEISAAVKNQQSSCCELLIYTRSGKEHWIDLRVIPFIGDAKSCDLIIGISRNITPRKAAFKGTFRDDETLEFVLEAAGLGYWDLDVESNQTARSLRHDQIFGHDEALSEWTYETFLSHVFIADRCRVDAVFQQAMSEGSDYDVEFRCQYPDKSIRWLWSKGRFLTNQQKEVIRAAGIQVDITEKKLAESKIEKLAYSDELTQLPNKAAFNERLEAAIAKSDRNNTFGALLFLDLDDFKLINDTLGHHIGDQLLNAIAVRLKSKLRNVNTIARFGGDEFVMIIDDLGSDINQARVQLDNIHLKICELFIAPFCFAENEIYSSVSIGITLFNGNKATTNELLQQADLAMYFAKDSGKKTMRYFNDEMRLNLLSRTSIENDLRQAIKKQEFYLVYQPKVDTFGNLHGFEALIRWLHPTKGIVSPIDFIPIAEQTGMIIPIGQWVLEQSCLFLSKWAQLDIPHGLSLSVNISPVQFSQRNFVEQIQTAIAGLSFSASTLILEITENTLIDNLADSIVKINMLTKHGVSFSLDDFGTGYSSFLYLKTLPIGEIKIDKSFVDGIVDDEYSEAIVSAIVSIADKLALNVVAEGVETAKQLQFLNELGATIFQGYHFSKSLSEADALAFLQDNGSN